MKTITLFLGALTIMAAAVLLGFSIVAADAVGIIIGLGSMAGVIMTVNLIYDV